MKSCADLLSPFIAHLFNRSLSTGVFPMRWKNALVTPILKKGKSDLYSPASYRPISKLPLLSKVLERIVSSQLHKYLRSNNLLSVHQSANKPHHSTETSVLKICNDIFRSLDKGNLCLLALLDLSAAFDSVDHSTLFQRLNTSFGICWSVLGWIRSFRR